MREDSWPWFDGWSDGVGLEELRFGFDGGKVVVRCVGLERVVIIGGGGG